MVISGHANNQYIQCAHYHCIMGHMFTALLEEVALYPTPTSVTMMLANSTNLKE